MRNDGAKEGGGARMTKVKRGGLGRGRREGHERGGRRRGIREDGGA